MHTFSEFVFIRENSLNEIYVSGKSEPRKSFDLTSVGHTAHRILSRIKSKFFDDLNRIAEDESLQKAYKWIQNVDMLFGLEKMLRLVGPTFSAKILVLKSIYEFSKNPTKLENLTILKNNMTELAKLIAINPLYSVPLIHTALSSVGIHGWENLMLVSLAKIPSLLFLYILPICKYLMQTENKAIKKIASNIKKSIDVIEPKSISH